MTSVNDVRYTSVLLLVKIKNKQKRHKTLIYKIRSISPSLGDMLLIK